MGYVVSFTPRAAGQPAKSSSGEAAAIIIFPGVRYERAPEAKAAQNAVVAATKRRPPKH